MTTPPLTDPELTAAVALGCQRAYEELGIAELQATNLLAEAHLRNNIEAAREPLAYSPSATRRAEVLEAHDQANTPYQRMRRRADRAEARCVDLEAEVVRLRGLLAAAVGRAA